MYGGDYFLAGIGLAIGGGTIAYFVAKAYEARRLGKESVARFSALEKLLDTYGRRMEPGEFLDYANSMGLIDAQKNYGESLTSSNPKDNQ